MKVYLARNAGFCMGVRRAVEATLETVRESDGPIATYGPLIHNPQVLDLLAERGVRVLKQLPRESVGGGTVIIRAHGVTPEEKDAISASGAEVRDATCPRVQKVQAIIRRQLADGAGAVVIIGDRNHAEVDGLMGYAGDRGVVVSNEDDVAGLDLPGSYIIVSQTTQDEATFSRLSDMILARFPGGRVFSTICDSTHKRQSAVLELCDRVDAMVVVGGRTSANTKRLGEIVAGRGKPVFVIESEEELDRKALAGFSTIGVTAGASTPSWIIERVIRYLEMLPGVDENPWKCRMRSLAASMVSLSIYAALGAGFAALAVDMALGGGPDMAHFVIAFAYIFSMYNLNRLMARPRPQFVDPLRHHYLSRRRGFLWAAALAATVTALAVAWRANREGALILALITAGGAVYNLRLLPRPFSRMLRFARLREIPGSKTIFSALAWVAVLVVVPHGLSESGTALMAALFLMIFFRNGIYDLMEMQSDRIMGGETIPVFLGEQGAARLLWGVLAAGIVAAAALPLVTPGRGGAFLLPGWLFLGVVYRLFRRGRLKGGFGVDLAVDSVFPFLFAVSAALS